MLNLEEKCLIWENHGGIQGKQRGTEKINENTLLCANHENKDFVKTETSAMFVFCLVLAGSAMFMQHLRQAACP